MASEVFIFKYITGSSTVNKCMGLDFLVGVGEGTNNNKILSMH
jgi:hypothetical protein